MYALLVFMRAGFVISVYKVCIFINTKRLAARAHTALLYRTVKYASVRGVPVHVLSCPGNVPDPVQCFLR